MKFWLDYYVLSFQESSKKEESIFIICKSRVDAFRRRDSVRWTWKTYQQEFPISVIFIVGTLPENKPGTKRIQASLFLLFLKAHVHQ